MKRCNKHKEWGVIDTSCRDCKREEERAEYIGLMNGDAVEMKPVRETRTNIPHEVTRVRNAATGEVKPVRDYTDANGIIDNALILHGEA